MGAVDDSSMLLKVLEATVTTNLRQILLLLA
jgi:hypothetical protein